jgi:hypothetical protein
LLAQHQNGESPKKWSYETAIPEPRGCRQGACLPEILPFALTIPAFLARCFAQRMPPGRPFQLPETHPAAC